jgi:ATP-dependent DNA ligase
VVDGEIFVAIGERLEFERLQERIHPAESRVTMLAEKTPASFVAFDLLAIDDESLMKEPFAVRRTRLEKAMSLASAPVYLTRTTTDAAEAQDWFAHFEGAGLDGVVAKPMTAPYQPNVRTMLKIKHERTADVVVAGYRLHKTSTPEKPLLGSLLLGLYDDRGTLQHVGVAAAFNAKRRAELVEELAPLVVDTDEHPWGSWAEAEHHNVTGDRLPGSPSPRSACSRSATTTWKAPASGTPPSSSAGAQTETRRRADMRSWRSRSATTWVRS